jgi:3-oxoacyl-[acyl-carrier-protein] synthase-3
MGLSVDAVSVVTGDHLHTSARKLADRAIEHALAAAGLAPGAVDLLVNAGIYHDRILGEPALAALIQEDIGANAEDPHEGTRGTFSFDVANGAAGALSGLEIADGFHLDGTIERAVVVASDCDPGHGLAPDFPYDPTAAALVCSRADDDHGILGFRWATNPAAAELRSGVLRFEDGRNRLRIHEDDAFAASAAALAAKVATELLSDVGMTAADLTHVVAAPFEGSFLDELASHLGPSAPTLVRPTGRHRFHTAGLLAALADVVATPPEAGGERVLLVAAAAGIVAGAALLTR